MVVVYFPVLQTIAPTVACWRVDANGFFDNDHVFVIHYIAPLSVWRLIAQHGRVV